MTTGAEANVAKPTRPSAVAIWIGRAISFALAALLIMSAVMKIVGGPELEEGLDHLGLPASMMLPLAVVELTCAIIYLIPPTAVLGAILLTGYMGGAICTHWRVGDVFVTQIVVGVLLWVAIYLRDPRLRQLIPIRRDAAARP